MEARISAHTNDEIINRIIAKHIARSARGMSTYFTSLADNNTKTPIQWLDEAIEEALDMAVYLEKLRDVLVNASKA